MSALTAEQLDALDAAAIEAAEAFADWYYKAINDERKPQPAIAQAYTTSSPAYKAAGAPPAEIVVGGARLGLPQDLERMLAAQRRLVGSARPARVVHEVESLDVHVANPDYRVAAPAELLVAGRMPPHQRLQLLVSVDGVVRFGDGPQAVVKTFHENFILVPNWDVLAQTRSGGRPTTRYLISSQNFRRAG